MYGNQPIIDYLFHDDENQRTDNPNAFDSWYFWLCIIIIAYIFLISWINVKQPDSDKNKTVIQYE